MKNFAWLFAVAVGVSLTGAHLQDSKEAPKPAPAAPSEVEKLVADLGADNFETRESADRLLRKVGRPAIPALKKALESRDPEVRARARRILAEIEAAETPKPKAAPRASTMRMKVVTPAYTLDVGDDGVKFEDRAAGKTYEAESMEKFKEKYPDLVKQHDLDQWSFSVVPARPLGLPRLPGGEDFPDFDFGFGFDRQFDDLLPPEFRKHLEEQRRLMDESLKRSRKEFEDLMRRYDERRGEPPPPATPPARSGAKIGIEVDGVGDTLRAQLGLAEDEGVLVAGVGEGTPAAKAGLLKHDVIVAVNGQKVGNRWTLRRLVSEALEAKGEVELTRVRQAKRETVKVKLD